MLTSTWSDLSPHRFGSGEGGAWKARTIRTAYYAGHEAVRWPLLFLNRLFFGVLLGSPRLPPSELPKTVRAVRRRYRDLQRKDLEHAARGTYPVSELFAAPFAQYARVAPSFFIDALKVVGRARAGNYDDLPGEGASALPAYYRRCFHWQTDGYLSDHSARLYDLGVEILFGGMADAMRRQVIGELGGLPPNPAILDVGCGTGRLLRQLRAALPRARLTGIDMSEAYVRHARSQLDGAALVETGNAEALPYADQSFDAVVSVFMFHELPRRVRQRVFSEMVRVLKPGGVLVIEDAAQLSDSPELAAVLRQFPRDLHEPFFAQYLDDPLENLFAPPLGQPRCQPVFVAKLVSARKHAV
ncbi:MAG TPA: class I SAM-dependent methyltransferase [Polyangiaceae bacterium]|nr:class I SAM-dependent methyltransferase [Polyangiaceae bacterium]